MNIRNLIIIVFSAVICGFGFAYSDTLNTVYYKRDARPKFKSRVLQDAHTRMLMDDLDIKNNRFKALLVRGQEVLCALEVSYTEPPKMIRENQLFQLVVSVNPENTGAGDTNQFVGNIRIVLTPEGHFNASGYPVVNSSTLFTIDELCRDARGEASKPPYSQKVDVVLEQVESKKIDCGFIFQLGLGSDLHEISIVYSYKRRTGRWRGAVRVENQVEIADSGEGKAGDSTTRLPTRPWRDETYIRYFSEYVANLNDAIREVRGIEWSVDSWGREIGPDTMLPVLPSGSWENSNHYLWGKNMPYDFYNHTIREYLQARLQGESVNDLRHVP